MSVGGGIPARLYWTCGRWSWWSVTPVEVVAGMKACCSLLRGEKWPYVGTDVPVGSYYIPAIYLVLLLFIGLFVSLLLLRPLLPLRVVVGLLLLLR